MMAKLIGQSPRAYYDSHNPFIPESVVKVSQDHRYRGFPNGLMEQPRVPVTYSPREAWSPRNYKDNKEKESYRKPLPPTVKESSSNQPQYGRRKWESSNPLNLGDYNSHYDSKEPKRPVNNETRENNHYEENEFQYSRRSHLPPPPPLPPANMDSRHGRKQEEMNNQQNKNKTNQGNISSAEQEIQMLKEEKRKRMLAEELEKKQNLYQLENYHPWGKPGGGAPRANGDDTHRKKFLEEDRGFDHIQDKHEHEGLTFHSPGGGAPLRSESGEVKAELRGDPIIRFRDNYRGNKNLTEPIRYKAPPEVENAYAKELDKIMTEKAIFEQKSRENDLKAELETLKYDPFGRPGAGAPNVRPHREYNNNQQAESDYNPWGKGAGQPRRDADGNVERYPYHNRLSDNVLPPKYRGVEELTLESRRRAPLNSLDIGNNEYKTNLQPFNSKFFHNNPQDNNNYSTAFVKPNQPTENNRHNQQRNDPRNLNESSDKVKDLYYPFGSPGGGAPNIDAQGNIMTTVYGNSTINRDSEDQMKKTIAAKMYNDELEKEVLQHRLYLMKDRQQIRAPIGELSEIMRQGQTGRPRRDERTGLLMDHHLPSSDVTVLKNISPRLQHQNKFENFEKSSNKYGTELEKAAEDRRRFTELERLRERQEVQQHLVAFNDLWGRPGGGAPRSDGTKMVNFDQALYYPDQMLQASHYRDRYGPI